MLQFLPALILMLLQSQGYANRIGAEKVHADLLSVGYRQSVVQPANRAVRDVQRALLVQLLQSNSGNPVLSGRLLDLLQAMDEPVAVKNEVVETEAENQTGSLASPDESFDLLSPLRSAQRLRDGPLSFV